MLINCKNVLKEQAKAVWLKEICYKLPIKKRIWIHTQLNAEFQRIVQRDLKKKKKKTFLSEQYKETEDNNIIGKTRDLSKKLGDSNG